MSRKHSSDILGYVGTVFEIIKALIHAVLDAGGSDRDIRKILSDKKKAAQIAEILMTTNVGKLEWSSTFPMMSWFEAERKAEEFNQHIRKDEKEWRLPTKEELLTCYCNFNLVSFFWSSTLDSSGDLVFVANGCESDDRFANKEGKLCFCLVRPNE